MLLVSSACKSTFFFLSMQIIFIFLALRKTFTTFVIGLMVYLNNEKHVSDI